MTFLLLFPWWIEIYNLLPSPAKWGYPWPNFQNEEYNISLWVPYCRHLSRMLLPTWMHGIMVGRNLRTYLKSALLTCTSVRNRSTNSLVAWPRPELGPGPLPQAIRPLKTGLFWLYPTDHWFFTAAFPGCCRTCAGACHLLQPLKETQLASIREVDNPWNLESVLDLSSSRRFFEGWQDVAQVRSVSSGLCILS